MSSERESLSASLGERYNLGPLLAIEHRDGYRCANCGKPSSYIGHWRESAGGFVCEKQEDERG